MFLEESNYLLESYLINEKDIYYNKDKFDSGEINLCFITGFSGSGKSTMADKMSSKRIESYCLDDVVENFRFSDDSLKEYGDLIYKYFTTVGKEFRYNEKNDDVRKLIRKNLITFIKFAISYAKSHSSTKFIIDGIQLYGCFSPTDLPFKEYAVYIKGTSKVISSLRATKRESERDKSEGNKVTLKDEIKIFNAKMKSDKNELKYLKEWYTYFSKLERSKL